LGERSLASYFDVRYGKDTEHRQGSPFKIKSSGESTSQIERFHGTIKDRTKVMRAFRNIETLHQFMDGYLTYYNFFKPNEALNGKTPAEAAGVDYQIKNWKELCQIPVPKQIDIQSRKTQITGHKIPRITPPRPRISEKRGRLR
jgi:hypothetical protein